MALTLTVLAENQDSEARWVKQLTLALERVPDLEATFSQEGQVIFVDAKIPRLSEKLAEIDRRGRAIFLILDENAKVPSVLAKGEVDDVLVHPFRPLEVLGKLRHYQQILMWEEVSHLNSSFSELLQRLHEDLRLAERLQKSRLPVRFPDVKGFKVSSRYLAGMRSGGDHFDLAESRMGTQLSMILSDSSSYGLSSAVLSSLMRVTMKLSSEEVRSSLETVQKIHEELALTLSEKDRLSIFYGVLSRKDLRLRYLNLGSSRAFLASASKSFEELPSQGNWITRTSGIQAAQEGEVSLSPDDRLVLVSDGFLDAAGGAEKTRDLLNEFKKSESADLLNELVFRVKSGFADPDDLPAQDCTAVIFDIDSRVIRLTPSESST